MGKIDASNTRHGLDIMVKQTKNNLKGAAAKGAGPGRVKGVPNKNTQAIRDMIAEALDSLGGVSYLMECGKDPRTKSAFLGLVGKVMPVQVIGDEKNPLQHHWTISFKAPNGN